MASYKDINGTYTTEEGTILKIVQNGQSYIINDENDRLLNTGMFTGYDTVDFSDWTGKVNADGSISYTHKSSGATAKWTKV